MMLQYLITGRGANRHKDLTIRLEWAYKLITTTKNMIKWAVNIQIFPNQQEVLQILHYLI